MGFVGFGSARDVLVEGECGESEHFGSKSVRELRSGSIVADQQCSIICRQNQLSASSCAPLQFPRLFEHNQLLSHLPDRP